MTPKKEARKLRPREPIAAAPLSVSQLTSLALLGMDSRRYLDLVRDHKVDRARVGKLIVVEVETMRDLLRKLAVEKTNVEEPENEEHDDEPTTVDDVLARLGRKRAG